jgi:hypothetical protein
MTAARSQWCQAHFASLTPIWTFFRMLHSSRCASSAPSFQSLSRCINTSRFIHLCSNQRMSIPKPLGHVSWQASCEALPAHEHEASSTNFFQPSFFPSFLGGTLLLKRTGRAGQTLPPIETAGVVEHSATSGAQL